jgi:aminoglycoside phosphotransferase
MSGADVFLTTVDGEHWFVRKTAQQRQMSERLRRQAKKQAKFLDRSETVLHAPRILRDGEIEGRYFFDMEFARGFDGVSYLRRASYDEVIAFGRRLCRYLETAAHSPPLRESEQAALFDVAYEKVCEVQDKTGLISEATLAELFLILGQLRHLETLPPSLCHGDLTLENMVVGGDGEIWAVDFLDSPFEHYWQDVAKIHQDLAGGWYLRNQAAVSQCVLDYLSRCLLEAAARLHEAYCGVHAVLMAMNFVRILPYARTPAEVGFVRERLDYFVRTASRRVAEC